MNVSVNGFLSLYDSPVMNWRLVQGESCPLPVLLGLAPAPLQKYEQLQIMNEVLCHLVLHKYTEKA